MPFPPVETVPTAMAEGFTAVSSIGGGSVAETVIISMLVPANCIQPGDWFRVRAGGDFSTQQQPTFRMRLRVGPTTLTGTPVADIVTGATTANAANLAKEDYGSISFITTGTAGTAGAFLSVTNNQSGVFRIQFEAPPLSSATPLIVIDTTVNLRFELTFQWTSAQGANIPNRWRSWAGGWEWLRPVC